MREELREISLNFSKELENSRLEYENAGLGFKRENRLVEKTPFRKETDTFNASRYSMQITSPDRFNISRQTPMVRERPLMSSGNLEQLASESKSNNLTQRSRLRRDQLTPEIKSSIAGKTPKSSKKPGDNIWYFSSPHQKSLFSHHFLGNS